MGMIGCYIRMDDENVKEFQNGAELDRTTWLKMKYIL